MSKIKNKSKNKVEEELSEYLTDDAGTKRINWFPGHMNKAVKKIKERLKQVDIVLEIRDARSPLATGNKVINDSLGEKSRLIVLNKTNLADPEVIKLWQVWFEAQETPFVFINCFDKNSLLKITQNAKKIVKEKRLKSNPDKEPRSKLRMMIIGLPNTGKSTIINKLANRNATKVADKPGQTRLQLWVKVDNDLELLDTPGVMPPKIDKYEHGLWLAALNSIPEKIVNQEDSSCFVIEHLIKTNPEGFQTHYKIETLDTDLVGILNQIAKSRGCIKKKNEYDYDRVYKMILLDLRSGDLGPVSFGIPPKLKN